MSIQKIFNQKSPIKEKYYNTFIEFKKSTFQLGKFKVITVKRVFIQPLDFRFVIIYK